MKTNLNILLAAVMLLLATSCGKTKADPHVPPAVNLKTTSGYTYSENITVNKQDTLLVGVIVEKTEDDLKSYNVSFRYDGNTISTTFFNYIMSDSEKLHYEKDVQIIARNQSGTEVWLFSVVDRDGNLTQKTITLTVQ